MAPKSGLVFNGTFNFNRPLSYLKKAAMTFFADFIPPASSAST
jgi:hypothetical protein